MSEVLRRGEVSLLGRVATASNLTLLVSVTFGTEQATAIYKPVSGERPLWDFPDGTLAAREVAARLVSEGGGWGTVPPTVLREDGPLGPGSLQEWVGPVDGVPDAVVDVVPAGRVPPGWLPVLEGEDAEGRPVVVVHEDTPDLRSVAVLDAVINNGDRKGGHLIRVEGHLWGVDHGVSFHVEDKLRTVLWAWAGRPLPATETERLAALRTALAGTLREELEALLTADEVDSLAARVEGLLATGRHPAPSGTWPAIPWPPL